jgi:hypothetical protein
MIAGMRYVDVGYESVIRLLMLTFMDFTCSLKGLRSCWWNWTSVFRSVIHHYDASGVILEGRVLSFARYRAYGALVGDDTCIGSAADHRAVNHDDIWRSTIKTCDSL